METGPIAADQRRGWRRHRRRRRSARCFAVSGVGLLYLLLFVPEAGLLAALLLRPMLNLFNHGLVIPGFGKPLDPSSLLAITLNPSVRHVCHYAPHQRAAGSSCTSVRGAHCRGDRLSPRVEQPINHDHGDHSARGPGCHIHSDVLGGEEPATGGAAGRRPGGRRVVTALLGIRSNLTGHGRCSASLSAPASATEAGRTVRRRAGRRYPSCRTRSYWPFYLLESRRSGERLAYVGLLVLLLVSFYLTLARGPWLAFVAALSSTGRGTLSAALGACSARFGHGGRAGAGHPASRSACRRSATANDGRR